MKKFFTAGLTGSYICGVCKAYDEVRTEKKAKLKR